MKGLKIGVIVLGVLSAIAIGIYLWLVKFPGDRAFAEATSLCASVPTGRAIGWDLIDAGKFMKVDESRADRSQPPADGVYLTLTSGGAMAQYGCEIELVGGVVKVAHAVVLPGWN